MVREFQVMLVRIALVKSICTCLWIVLFNVVCVRIISIENFRTRMRITLLEAIRMNIRIAPSIYFKI